ncbi:MAG: S-methyl-5'-thioadenosine phosphorylase [Desulfosarcinaceae bacterium]|nr:S-methyl-5'-thioadenosine phosphorylase [Desulfosarcinaceae bacterium]
MAQSSIEIGIVGGSGLYALEGLHAVQEVALDTPFGKPSDTYITGTLGGRRVAFLPRHGRGHRFTPSEVNYRANIYGFKQLGVGQLLAVTAVGSLREKIHPGEIVLPDQLVDRTRRRESSFFGSGLVAHIPFADPFCSYLVTALATAAGSGAPAVHPLGTLVCIEGPAFSTRAEAHLYRQWGCDIVGMTTLQEAKLAREAEICYAAMAMVTDYDCWHATADAVTADAVSATMAANIETAKGILTRLIPQIHDTRGCSCQQALSGAIMSAAHTIPAATRSRLALLIDKYLPGDLPRS